MLNFHFVDEYIIYPPPLDVKLCKDFQLYAEVLLVLLLVHE